VRVAWLVVKKALLVLLVLVVVVTGLPVVVGGSSMATCPECGPTLGAVACTVAILAGGVALLLALLARRLRSRRDVMAPLLHSFLLERPPRLA
jgi:hypothetical protein